MIRRPGESSSSVAGGFCLIIFGLVFAVIPLLILASFFWHAKFNSPFELVKLLFLVIPGIFLLIGGGLAYSGLQSIRTAKGVGVRPAQIKRSIPGQFVWGTVPYVGAKRNPRGGYDVKPDTSGKAGAFFLLLFGTFWTGISTLILMKIQESGKGPAFLLWFFVAIGVIILGSALFTFYKGMVTGTTSLELSEDAIPVGRSSRYTVYQNGRYLAKRVQIYLLGQETASYGSGTDRVTKHHVFLEQLLQEQSQMQIDPRRPVMEGTLQIPTGNPPTFVAPNNEIRWYLRIKIEIDGRPDVDTKFETRIVPAGGAA